MRQDTPILEELIEMSLWLAEPSRECVILGEGNTSAKVDAETFYVKASGAQLPQGTADSFVQVYSEPLLELLDGPDFTDDQIKEALGAACVDADGKRPSTETVFHALLLDYPDVNFVGHTHPVSVNSLLCSTRWEKLLSGRLFPDEIVVCGEEYVLVPYTDPGLVLAREVNRRVAEYADRVGAPPRTILIQNHGLIALGATSTMVKNITAMMDKTARIILGACAAGGVHALTEANVSRISTRPDEKYRQQGLDATR
jgi:rhamnose utilization protein RhaD (predicted bifunctional aldolase and dehydrogenase)